MYFGIKKSNFSLEKKRACLLAEEFMSVVQIFLVNWL